MKEIICIHVGQGGIQMSNAAWELFCMEHGISADGTIRSSLEDNDSKAFGTFFYLSPSEQCVPRSITVDLEPTVIDEIRTGSYRNLFHPDSLISGDEDAASNFARGHFTKGKFLIDSTMQQIRKVLDNCEKFEGFLVICSYGGGTGSGFQTLILERLSLEYAKKLKMSVVIFPCPKLSTSTVEPYNAVLTCHYTLEHGDMSVFLDNESVYEVCCRTLDLNRPTYSNLNRIIAQVYSSMTASLRFESTLQSDMDQMVTNLIPYPRIHYEMINYSPIISVNRAKHEQMSTIELSRNLFNIGSQFLDVNLQEGKYMSCCLQYRGDVTPREVNDALFQIKKRTDVKFVDWCPTGFKVGISSQPPSTIPESGLANFRRSVAMISNTSAIAQLFERTNRKFFALYVKRAFVHWYVGEGIEEGEFNEAVDNLSYLIRDYKELELGVDESLPAENISDNKVEKKATNVNFVDNSDFQEKEHYSYEDTNMYVK